MDSSEIASSEIKYVSISRVNDAQLLLGVASDKTKKAYAEEVCPIIIIYLYIKPYNILIVQKRGIRHHKQPPLILSLC